MSVSVNVNQVVKEIGAFLLEDIGGLQQIVREMNSWDGSFEQFDVWENDEEFFNTFFEGKPLEAVRATFYGDFRYMDEYVRFNGYGNLESLNEYQIESELKDSIDEIVSHLIDIASHVDLPEEVEAMIENYYDLVEGLN